MTKVAITEQYLEDIADAIREKTGLTTATYYPADMATAILSISGGGGITPTGTIEITTNGTHNVTSYAYADVSVPSSSPTISSLSVTPTTSEQTFNSSSVDGYKPVVVAAMPSGTVTAPATISGSSATVSTGTNTLTLSKTVSVTPSVSTAGYVSSGTAGNSSVSLTASVTTKGATTYTPTTSDQTIASGTYLTGAQTISGSSNLVASNIKKNVTIFGVTGSYEGGGGTPTLETVTKTYTPTTSKQEETVTPSSGYDGIGQIDITVNAMSTMTLPTSATSSGQGNLKATIDRSTSDQYINIPTGYNGIASTYKISAVANTTLPTSTSASATSGYTSKATISPSTSDQYINIAAGYNTSNVYYKISAMSTMTLPTSATSSATSGYTSKATISRSTSDQYINIPTGYNSAGAYYKISAVANGSATGPSSLSGSSATVSTGTNTITLTKTGVTTTPTVSAGYVASATASTATVALTASVTTKSAATITPGITDQTIASGTYLTGTQTIAGDANLVANNIKKNVSIFGVTGAYEGSGGGSGLTVATANATPSSASTSISFTNLAGEPTSFAVVSAADLATGASPWKTAAVVFDGTDLHGQTIRNTSNAQVTYDGSSFSKTYSNGTLTITGSGTNFQANQYKLVYTYGGSDIGTASVQVGSGATSVTFTGLEEEPSYFSCIFKSNFSTSSGYQRVIVVVYDGTSTYGMEMDSSAKYSTAHWSYSYSNGSLTISSSDTNAGGYFHQPGYYQLTYAVEGSSGNYQSKTVYATSSQQVITADSGYDALKKVTIPGVTTTNLIASNILSGVTIQVGDAADSDRITSITGNVVLQNYYTGSSAPSSSTGSNGDLYLQS